MTIQNVYDAVSVALCLLALFSFLAIPMAGRSRALGAGETMLFLLLGLGLGGMAYLLYRAAAAAA